MKKRINQDTKKRKKGSRWGLGLKIVSGVIFLVILFLAVTGYFWLKDALVAFDEIKKSEKQLIKKYGRVESFCPDADGAIKPERMEVFLEVRENLVPLRRELEESLTKMLTEANERENENTSIWGVLKLMKDGAKMLPRAAKYFSTRNMKLLELVMGLGEYYYIYVISYYAGLGNTPDDGPSFGFLGAGNRNSVLYYAIQDMIKSKEERKTETEEGLSWQTGPSGAIPRVYGIIFSMMQCQLEQITIEKPSNKDNPESWRNLLSAEVEKMKSNHSRMPWQDGLPKVLKQSIEPFRERLKSSYIQLMNPLEFGLNKK